MANKLHLSDVLVSGSVTAVSGLLLGSDASVIHNGSNLDINNDTGVVTLLSIADVTKLRISDTNIITYTDFIVGTVSDGTKVKWGQSQDASMYYDGSNLIIDPKEVGTGKLRIMGGVVSSGSLGQVEIFDGYQQWYTRGGANYFSCKSVGGYFLWRVNDDENAMYLNTDGSLHLTQDDAPMYFGADDDSYVKHNGSNMFINNDTGLININNGGANVVQVASTYINLKKEVRLDDNDLRVKEIAAPLTPASTYGKFFLSSVTNNLSIVKDTGVVVDLEAGGGTTALSGLTDDTVINQATLVSGHVLAHNGTNWINSSSIEAGGGGTGTPLSVTSGTVQTRTIIKESGVTADTPDFWVSGLAEYDHLELIIRAATDRASQTDTVWVEWNGDADATNYNFFQGLTGDGNVDNVSDLKRIAGTTAASRANTDSLGHTHVIMSYTNRSDRWKSGTFQSIEGAGSGFDFLINGATMWEDNSPITDARFFPGVGTNFLSGSHFQVIGVKEESIVKDVTGTTGATISGVNVLATTVSGVDANFSGELAGCRTTFTAGKQLNAGIDGFLDTDGQTHGALLGMAMMRPGSITGLSCRTDGVIVTTAGVVRINATINGSIVYYAEGTIDGSGRVTITDTQPRGTNTFVEGDLLGFYFDFRGTTNASLKIMAAAEVVFDT